jgi:hypothetical protein
MLSVHAKPVVAVFAYHIYQLTGPIFLHLQHADIQKQTQVLIKGDIAEYLPS